MTKKNVKNSANFAIKTAQQAAEQTPHLATGQTPRNPMVRKNRSACNVSVV